MVPVVYKSYQFKDNLQIRFTYILPTDEKQLYGGITNYFTIRVNHSGVFTQKSDMKYVNGTVDYFDFVDADLFSVHEFEDMLEMLGYMNREKMCYQFRIPEIELEYGLMPLVNDQDVNLCKYVSYHKVIDIYIQHMPSMIEEMNDNQPISPELHRSIKITKIVGSCSKKLDLDAPVLIDDNHVNAIVPLGRLDMDDIVGEGDDSDFLDDDTSSDSDFNMEDNTVVDDIDVEMGDLHGVHYDLDYPSLQQTIESTHDSDDDFLAVVDTDMFESTGIVDEPREKMIYDLLKSKPCSSGVLHPKLFKLGQKFKSKKDIKALVDMHSIDTKGDLYYAKNDKNRLRVKCRGVTTLMNDGRATRSESICQGKKVISKESCCPWVLLVSRANEEEDWMVKTLFEEHTCMTTRSLKACTAKFLAGSIVQQVESNPTIPTRALHDDLQQNFQLGISYIKAFRAKSIAQQHIHGDYQNQYTILRDYALELKRCDTGTNVKIQVHSEPNLSLQTRVFKRIYICLGALKNGFKAGCRDFLGLDGTFMKGPYPGQILTAVGLDSNNGIYPLAYAVVESENTNSWTWFLENLAEDLDLTPRCNFTFISDRQKGILPAIAKVFPAAEHRYCLRHVYENMKLSCKDKVLEDLVWKCGKATSIPGFDKAMEDLKKVNEQAHAWLCKIPPKHWARAHFTGRALSDVVTNNLCEVFNSKIGKARDKPIITCLEYIREYLMRRICSVQKEIEKLQGPLTPTATTLLENAKKEAAEYRVIFAGNGIPCKHAICAMFDKIDNREVCGEPEEWVHDCYKLHTWKEMYKYKVEPINGRNMWEKSQCPFTLTHPKHHTQVGRPKKKRKRAAGEEPSQGKNLSRKFLTVTCTKCKNKGHNSRICKGQGGDK
ncbi:hypothetical protein LXL04_008410 [Taraxacum kok-saghyz]